MKAKYTLGQFTPMKPLLTCERNDNIDHAKEFIRANIPLHYGTHLSFEETPYRNTLFGRMPDLSLLGNAVIFLFEIDLSGNLKAEMERVHREYNRMSKVCEKERN